jgi:hypothetical protein
VNRLLEARAELEAADPARPGHDALVERFCRQAAEVRSRLEAAARGTRGQTALLEGLWQRADYTNDLLLAILNQQRHSVSCSPSGFVAVC